MSFFPLRYDVKNTYLGQGSRDITYDLVTNKDTVLGSVEYPMAENLRKVNAYVAQLESKIVDLEEKLVELRQKDENMV